MKIIKFEQNINHQIQLEITWKLYSFMQTDRKKDADCVLEHITKVLEKYEVVISSKTVFVSDRGSNMLAALKDTDHVSCVLHFLCNCLKQVFDKGRPMEVLIVVKKIIRFIKK